MSIEIPDKLGDTFSLPVVDAAPKPHGLGDTSIDLNKSHRQPASRTFILGGPRKSSEKRMRPPDFSALDSMTGRFLLEGNLPVSAAEIDDHHGAYQACAGHLRIAFNTFYSKIGRSAGGNITEKDVFNLTTDEKIHFIYKTKNGKFLDLEVTPVNEDPSAKTHASETSFELNLYAVDIPDTGGSRPQRALKWAKILPGRWENYQMQNNTSAKLTGPDLLDIADIIKDEAQATSDAIATGIDPFDEFTHPIGLTEAEFREYIMDGSVD